MLAWNLARKNADFQAPIGVRNLKNPSPIEVKIARFGLEARKLGWGLAGFQKWKIELKGARLEYWHSTALSRSL